MKTTNLKCMSYALAALMLMQSCTVYQKNLSSINDAIGNEKMKKLVTSDDESYKVKNIQKEDGHLILISQKQSMLTKKLSSFVTEIYSESDQVRLEIPLDNIKGFYLKDKRKSTILTITSIALPILVLGVLVYHELRNFCLICG